MPFSGSSSGPQSTAAKKDIIINFQAPELVNGEKLTKINIHIRADLLVVH